MNFTNKLNSTPPASLNPSTLPPRSFLPPFVVAIIRASRNIGAATSNAFAQAGATGLILTAPNGPVVVRGLRV